MTTCPWDRDLEVGMVGDGFYVGPFRIPSTDVPEFLTWLNDVATGGTP